MLHRRLMRWCLSLMGFLMVAGIPLITFAKTQIEIKPSVTLVEYYDYECPHCRRMAVVIDRLKRMEPPLHIVYRVTPILNQRSWGMAAFALAAKAQGQWATVHRDLMRLSYAPRVADAKAIVESTHLKGQKLLRTMKSPRIRAQLNRNRQAILRYAQRGIIQLPILVFYRTGCMRSQIALRGELI